VDEFGDGAPYAGLSYTLIDQQNVTYQGTLDSDGYGKQEDMFCGPVRLDISESYVALGADPWYRHLCTREKFPLPLTTLQVAAEQTRSAHRKPFEPGPPEERAKRENARYFHLEVRDFLTPATSKHLPDATVTDHRPSLSMQLQVKERHGERYTEIAGVPLEADAHHVLEIKALRAYSPLLSRDKAFCALNAYQLALMSVLAYAPFNQPRALYPEIQPPPYPNHESIAEVLHNHWARLRQPTQFNTASPYHLLYEEVPYSKRLEVVPYAPEIYTQEAADGWEFPEQVHYLHNKGDTQTYITHNDKVLLISVRGTQELGDALRDADARQVSFAEGEGQAHRGFYEAFVSTKKFISDYFEAFYTSGQTIIVTGHSLGGAIATLVAEWIRRFPDAPDVQLYTFGSPRVGDKAFVRAAADLTHHRLVNRDDPVPGVPLPWMDVEWKAAVPGIAMLIGSRGTHPLGWGLTLGGLLNMQGDDYEHHGEQRHFIPRRTTGGAASSVLWQPRSALLERGNAVQYSAEILLEGDLPRRKGLMGQLMSAADHSSDAGYGRAALSNLLRCIAAAWHRDGQLFTPNERKLFLDYTAGLRDSLKGWQPGSFVEFQHQLACRPDSRFADKTPAELMTLYTEDLTRLQHLRDTETKALRRTRERLKAQSEHRVSKVDVFGDVLQHPDLPGILSQWLDLADIQRASQLVKADLPQSMEVA
jgi:hypothetical protein